MLMIRIRMVFIPAGYKTSNQDHERRYVCSALPANLGLEYWIISSSQNLLRMC